MKNKNTRTLTPTSIQESLLQDALEDAQKVGYTEETFKVGRCRITLSTLTPEAKFTSLSESGEGSNLEFISKVQKTLLSQSIVQINDVDLREVDFIEVKVAVPEEEQVKNGPTSKLVQVPRPQWVQDNLLSTWSEQALDVVMRKYDELTERAEKECAQYVVFSTVDETGEQRYRRLLTELLVAGEDLPGTLKERILQEVGLVAVTAQAEAEQLLSAVGDPVSVQGMPVVTGAEPEAPDEDDDDDDEALMRPHMAPTVMSPPPVKSAPAPVPTRPQYNSAPIAHPLVASQPQRDPYADIGAVDLRGPQEVAPVRSPQQGRTPAHRDLGQIPIDQPPQAGRSSRFKPPQG